MDKYFTIQISDDEEDSLAILSNSICFTPKGRVKEQVFEKADKIFDVWSYEVYAPDEPFTEKEIKFLKNEIELENIEYEN